MATSYITKLIEDYETSHRERLDNFFNKQTD
jgi:hypothetical protein